MSFAGVPQAKGGAGRRAAEAQVPGGHDDLPVGVPAQVTPGQGKNYILILLV